MPKSSKGRRGWFGDSKRHAEAGRRGGMARGRRGRNRSSNSTMEAESVISE